MSFRINNNITSLSSFNSLNKTSNTLNASLGHLSSGLRITKAADDASGMSVADSLRAQANSLGQAIANGNDAIGMLQTADYAMQEQIDIIETIRVKSIQAASDAQNRDSRAAIQADIMRLLEEFDNIANTTSFNGKKLLNGNFSNQHFQIGAYSNQTIDISIGNTRSVAMGHITYNTSTPFVYQNSNNFDTAEWTFKMQYGTMPHEKFEFNFTGKDILEKGLGIITEQVNALGKEAGVRAGINGKVMSSVPILGSNPTWGLGPIDLEINGIRIVSNFEVANGDSDGLLVNAINSFSNFTGVTASNEGGSLLLTSANDLPIHINGNNLNTIGFMISDDTGAVAPDAIILGQLTFSQYGSSKPSYTITANNADARAQKGLDVVAMTNGTNSKFEDNNSVAFGTTNLHDFLSDKIDAGLSKSMGFGYVGRQGTEHEGGVLTYEGAQIMIDIAVVALRDIDRIRSDIGSAQNQISATLNNIAIAQVNIKAAESQIRDVDFAAEAASFNKANLLMQSGSYANAQANQIQQNVMRLLQ